MKNSIKNGQKASIHIFLEKGRWPADT